MFLMQTFPLPMIAIVGHKNSGKTRLVERVIGAFSRDGLNVAAVKHASDELGFDKPNKDSDRLKRAGAITVGLVAKSEVGFYTTRSPETTEAWIEGVLRLMPVCPDLVVYEGYRGGSLPKIECILDRSVRRPFLTAAEGLIAVVSDHAVQADAPVLGHEPLGPILDLIRRALPGLR